jgi:glutamine amidotransferase-like uncharacterized protein
MLRIQQFVERGGGYIGICGGAFLAAEEMIWQGWDGEQLNYRWSGLGIFSGQAEGPMEDFAPDYIEMCRVNVVEPRHAITQLGPDVYWMEYHHGPLLTPSDPAEVTMIGRYERGDHLLLMVRTHGAWRVFLSSSHPELAANADDGSDVTQVNWEWLSRAILWCRGAI